MKTTNKIFISLFTLVSIGFLIPFSIFAHGKGYGKDMFHHIFWEALEELDISQEQEDQIKELYDEQKKERSKKDRKYKKRRNSIYSSEELVSLIQKDNLTESDLETFFQSQQKEDGKKMNKKVSLVAGVHEVLNVEQRQKLVEVFQSEIQEKKEGSFFKKIFRSSPAKKFTKKISSKLDLTTEQEEKLKAIFPTEEDFNNIRKNALSGEENLITLFEKDTLTKEELSTAFENAKKERQEKRFALMKERFPQMIDFHTSLTTNQKNELTTWLEKRSKRGHKKQDD